MQRPGQWPAALVAGQRVPMATALAPWRPARHQRRSRLPRQLLLQLRWQSRLGGRRRWREQAECYGR